MKNQMKIVWFTYKSLVCATPLRITFDKVNGFIREIMLELNKTLIPFSIALDILYDWKAVLHMLIL